MTELLRPNRAERVPTDITHWEVGPFHRMLPGPMQLRLSLDGEIVVKGELETGFLHRGLEKAMELHSWQSIIPYADHLDPEAAVFGELALCLSVEEIADIPVPIRAQAIRIILSELSRISSHMAYIARLANATGAETIFHYVLRDREKILDLFELLSGARFSLCFLRFGGVRADMTEGFIERVLEVVDLLRTRLKEYNDLFSFNYPFLKRTAGVAPIHAEQVYKHGITGPNARAAGIHYDIRKSRPYSGYETRDFDIPIGRGQNGLQGDSHDRFLMRLYEISQSLEILKQTAENVPAGEFINAKAAKELVIPAGEAFSRVESARGVLGCHVVSDGKDKPCRVQFAVPSLAHLMVIPELLIGLRVEDVPVVLASLDVSIAEVDR